MSPGVQPVPARYVPARYVPARYVPARYVAVHLGEEAVTVLVDNGTTVLSRRYRLALSMQAGVLVHLEDDASETAGAQPDARTSSRISSRIEAERSLWSYVGDANVLVGSVAVPVDTAIQETLESALHRAGTVVPVQLLEIACPSSWGTGRQNVIRRAVMPLAHEVVVVDTATAAVQSLGERAPARAVVVELGDLASTVSSVCRSSDEDPEYVRSGLWDPVGSRDIAEGEETTSIGRRVQECVVAQRGRRDADVFVVDTTPNENAVDVSYEPVHRLHRLRGVDVVRSMAARRGIGEPAGGEAGTRDHDVTPRGRGESSPQSMRAPVPSRSAAWLDELHDDPQERALPVRMLAIGAAVALVLVVTGFVAVQAVSEPPATNALPREASVAARSSTADTATLPTTNLPTTTPPTPSTAPPATTTAVSVPEYSRFALGRVSVESPTLWSARTEPDRMILVPPEVPDRRIVVATVELVPGATFDDVADDLTRQMAESATATVENFTRATDYGGRIGVSYVETPGDESVVQWRVFVEDGLQISIGCQGAAGSEAELEEECARAVSSLEILPVG